MNIQWRVNLHPEVVRYVIKLRAEGEEIRSVIRVLPEKGLPEEAKLSQISNQWLWMDAKHWITCTVIEDDRAIYVTNVEPVEVVVKRTK